MTGRADDAYQHALATALESVTPNPPRTIEPLGRGNRKRTVLAQFDNRRPVVVQLCRDRQRIRTEATLLSRIRAQTPIPVPNVLKTGLADSIAFIVTPYVRGTNLHETFTALDPPSQRRIASTFGTYLAHLHERFIFDRYGTLTAVEGELTGETRNWNEWLAEYGLGAIDRLPSDFDPMHERLRAVYSGQPETQYPSARLFPWDFRPGNAVVADGEITAILDWETPMAATPALAAAKAEYLVADWYVDDPAPLRTAFVSGYETIREYPDVGPIHRVAAIADSAVDSNGIVTNPGYPELDREGAVDFHRRAFEAVL